MEDVVKAQEKMCVESWAALGNSPTMLQSCSIGFGCVSPAQVVEAMEDCWLMCRDELCLKCAILATLQQNIEGQDVTPLSALLMSNVNTVLSGGSIVLLQNIAAASS